MDQLQKKQWVNNTLVVLSFFTLGPCALVFDLVTGLSERFLEVLKEYRETYANIWISNERISYRRERYDRAEKQGE